MGDRSFFGGGAGAAADVQFSGAYVQSPATEISIPDLTATQITFGTVIWDTDGYWDAANNQFKCPTGKAGIFLIIGQVIFKYITGGHPSDGFRWVDMVEGTSPSFFAMGFPDSKIAPTTSNAFSDTRVQCICLASLSDGGTVILRANQDNLDSQDVLVDDAPETWFTICRLSSGTPP